MINRVVFRHGKSPYGLIIELTDDFITSIRFTDELPSGEPVTKFERKVFKTFTDYFSGKPVDPSTLPSKPEGTPFQRRVWKAVGKIPYGETRSYGEIALEIGSEKAARAVGMAMKTNPIPIVIPCHRVVGKWSLGGYSPDISIKKFLLELEGVDLRRF